MIANRIGAFSGRAPRTARRLLGPNQAQVATNCRLTNGQLQPLRALLFIVGPNVVDAVSIFRMDNGTTDYWLAWDSDVDVARGPIAGDTLQRIYWTGDGEPRMSHLSLATSAPTYPTAWYVLGVTPPTVAPTVTPSGGTGEADSRSYVYRFKTALGEASQPSPASAVTTGKVDDTWALSNMQAAPPNAYIITNAVWAAGVLTLTVSSSFGARVGERVAITGLAPAVLNDEFELASVPGTTSLTIAMADDPGTITDVAGTATRMGAHNTTDMTKEIYRTVTAASGDTEFRFVASIAVATTTYNDTIATSVVAQNEKLDSETYEMPPVDAKGIIALPNGIMAAFSKNLVCLSEPFKPHAWPSEYRQSVNYDIVALGFFGTTIVIGTEGTPYMLTGVEPSTMGGGMSGLHVAWPCLSKRGLVSTPFGVMYPAPQGLALIGIAGSEIATREFFTEVEWAALQPTTFIAAMRDNRYYAAYTLESGQRLVLVIDKGEVSPISDVNLEIDAFWTDPASGRLYVLQDDMVFEWDAYIALQYDWMSREFVTPQPINMGAAKIDAEFGTSDAAMVAAEAAAVIAANQVKINAGYIGAGLATLPLGSVETAGNLLAIPPEVVGLQFQLYVDNALKFTKTVTNAKAFKLPAGYVSDAFAVRVSGDVVINAIVLGRMMEDLKAA